MRPALHHGTGHTVARCPLQQCLFLILVRHAGPGTNRGRGIAVAAWSVISVLLQGTTVWAVFLGLVRLGLTGDEVQVVFRSARSRAGGARKPR